MKVWAITGGIASGKSTVAALFAARGATIRSADEDARAVLSDGSGTREAVLSAFPEAQGENGEIDRARLAARIFSDPEARRRLNALMHPAIRRRMRAAIDAARADPRPGVLLYEVPLLYEGGLETWFDGVIVTRANQEAQVARLQKRETDAGRSPLRDETLAERLAAQMPPEEKTRRADIVVRTDSSLDDTRAAVDAAWRRIASPD